MRGQPLQENRYAARPALYGRGEWTLTKILGLGLRVIALP
jgi:hypothetical protein